MGRKPKDEDKKLNHKIQVGLTDTDFSDFEKFKEADRVEGNSDAMRRFFRWAMDKWKTEQGDSPSGSP